MIRRRGMSIRCRRREGDAGRKRMVECLAETPRCSRRAGVASAPTEAGGLKCAVQACAKRLPEPGDYTAAARYADSCTVSLHTWDTRDVNQTSTPPANELTSAIALDIRTVFRRIKRQLREQGKSGELTATQVAVVLRLEESGSETVSSLARAEGMRPQSMSAAMLPLQQAGLVRGTPDPADGRQMLMSLTPKCHRWLKQRRDARQDWLTQRIEQRLSIREQERLRGALALLTKLTED